MPSIHQHISTWKRNRRLLQIDACAGHPEWTAIIAFYCALHAVEALLAKKSFPRCKDHATRNHLLALRENKLMAVWTPYKTLFDASLDARYTCPDIDERFAPPRLKDLIQSRFQSLEAVVIRELGLDRREFPFLEVDMSTGSISLKSVPPGSPH